MEKSQQTEKELRKPEELYKRLFALAADIIITVDLKGFITKDANEFENAINSYSNAWNEAFSKESQNDDESPLNELQYMIAKNAACVARDNWCIRDLGEKRVLQIRHGLN